MKRFALSASIFLLSPVCLQAVVSPGDISFTLFDADGGMDEGNDQFSFVALNAIAAGDQIYFRDDEWEGTAFAGNATGLSEGEVLWTAPAGGIAAGTVVTISALNVIIDGSVVGTVQQTIGTMPFEGLGLSGGGDEVWAFVGTSNTPSQILAAISSQGFDGTENTLTGTGLTANTAFAIELTNNIDHAQYIGPREGLTTVSEYTSLLQDVAMNWLQESPSDEDLIADGTPFVAGGDFQSLSLSFLSSTIAEDSGPIATRGTISLANVENTDVIVELSSSDITEATVPETVTIPAGFLTATFDIAAIDDPLDDGDRTVAITLSAPDILGITESLTVTDNDSPLTTNLATGDILFICFNADSDSFGFVALADIPAGEIIYFTDQEWDDSIDGFGDGEGDIIWTAPAAGLTAGEVVLIEDINSAESPPLVTGGGTVTQTGSTNLSSSDDTIYAYQGPEVRQPVTFLASIANHEGDSIINTGLTAGVDALFLETSADYGEYTEARTGQSRIAGYAPLIANIASNWTVIVGEANETIICDSSDFVADGIDTITIVDCGFIGTDFFIDIAEGTGSLIVISSDTLDFTNSSTVDATVDPNNSNRFLISSSERDSHRDFFRVVAP